MIPGTPSLVFLVWVVVLLPIAALRSARRLAVMRAANPGAAIGSRARIWAGTLVAQTGLFALTWFTARTFGYDMFRHGSLAWRDAAAGLAALAACMGLRELLRMIRPESERRTLVVYEIAPRTTGEWALSTATILISSVAEEAAYRGVGMNILVYSLGNPWLAACILAIAFALAHSLQGVKSGVIIFGIALVMHALVAVTGTLVVAMVVHATYDLVAGYFIGREAPDYVGG